MLINISKKDVWGYFRVFLTVGKIDCVLTMTQLPEADQTPYTSRYLSWEK